MSTEKEPQLMAAIPASTRPGFRPSAPQTFEELGISQSLVLDLDFGGCCWKALATSKA